MTNSPTKNKSQVTDADASVPQDIAELPGGGRMPLLGLGTWQIKGPQATDATRWALEAGYRHLDTATVYGNEKEVGAGLTDSGIAREEVFVTTKFPPEQIGHEEETLQASLSKLGVDSLDLWLVHAPGSSQENLAIWPHLVAAREQGLTKDIGVSNYSLGEIDEITKATGVAPAVNQIRWSPLLFDQEVLDGHRERGVVLEGYSALRGGTLDHPVIRDIATNLARTPPQVIIRWHLQHGVVVIPKSTQQERIAANADIADFTLADEDMAALDGLGQA